MRAVRLGAELRGALAARPLLLAPSLSRAVCWQVRRWEGHRRGVNAAVYAPRRGCAFTAGRDLTIRHWPRDADAPLRSLEGHDLNISALALDPDEARLCSGARDTTVRSAPPQPADR